MAVKEESWEEWKVFTEGRNVQGAAKKLIRPGRGDLVVGREKEKLVRLGDAFTQVNNNQGGYGLIEPRATRTRSEEEGGLVKDGVKLVNWGGNGKIAVGPLVRGVGVPHCSFFVSAVPGGFPPVHTVHKEDTGIG